MSPVSTSFHNAQILIGQFKRERAPATSGTFRIEFLARGTNLSLRSAAALPSLDRVAPGLLDPDAKVRVVQLDDHLPARTVLPCRRRRRQLAEVSAATSACWFGARLPFASKKRGSCRITADVVLIERPPAWDLRLHWRCCLVRSNGCRQ